MEIRPLTKAEWKYTYRQGFQIEMHTGCVGDIMGEFDSSGRELSTLWTARKGPRETDGFETERDGVIKALCIDKDGLLRSRSAMSEYAAQNPESVRQENGSTEYGLRVETQEHAYLIRCNPAPEDYHFYCYCYAKKWLDNHIKNAEQGIRFIDTKYNELFRIADGEKILITYAVGKRRENICRYIDEYHMEVDGNLFHICQYAEIMEKNGATYEPAKVKEKKEGVKKPSNVCKK